MAVTLDREVPFQYRRFSLYNSPYVAHERGRAIDLYPPADAVVAPSPVTGEVLETVMVEAPPKPYAAEKDHLVLVDTGEYVARLLHVEPQIGAGDRVERGDPLGELVRAGFFAPWVPNHVHLEFRDRDTDPYRASGSIPLEVAVDVEPVPWDGTGTVIETGDAHARLDRPVHPAPDERFAGLGSAGGVLDGGFPHYEWGGLLGGDGPANIAGTPVGTVSGREVAWHDATVRANGDPVTGIALFCGRDALGAKLVGRGVDFSVGEEVAVSVHLDNTAE
jgi:hypothetical protein